MTLPAIPRYGARIVAERREIVSRSRARGEYIQGPHIEQFEQAFARRAGVRHGITTSYARSALYYVLKALDLAAGSEIVVPALTFWAMPEIARIAGLKIVFADVDPATFTIDPTSLEHAITPATRVVLATHLYGLPCDMDAIVAIARTYGLRVIEDCTHALGATFDNRPVGTFGDAAIFSFQTFKPLNCYGGGMALTNNDSLARRVRTFVDREPWPSERRVNRRLLVGRVQETVLTPWGFTMSLFPILWVASLLNANPDVYPWEQIRPLDRFPRSYKERFSNVQAAIGLGGLDQLDEWTERSRAHARVMDAALGGLNGVTIPHVPPNSTHAYYQYSVYASFPDSCVLRCLRHGVDLETRHADVCSDLELFGDARMAAPGARRAARVLQIPVYATLTDEQVTRVARVVRGVLARATTQSSVGPLGSSECRVRSRPHTRGVNASPSSRLRSRRRRNVHSCSSRADRCARSTPEHDDADTAN